MSVYKRGKTDWFKFQFRGVTIRESAETSNKEQARDAERERHTALKNSASGITPRKIVPLFEVGAEQYIEALRSECAPKTIIGMRSSFALHLRPFFGGRLLSDITAFDMIRYRDRRMAAGASPKSIANEIGTVRGLLLFHDLDGTWGAIRKKVKLASPRKVGRCIGPQERDAILAACRASRSRSLYVAVVIALESGLRYSEIRLLQWVNVDFSRRLIVVGKSKTDAGEGREVPLNTFAYETLSMWAAQFPARKLNGYCFPSEKYGEGGQVYQIDSSRPIGSWKVAWQAAKKRAGITFRFHDLRHTRATDLLSSGVGHTVVAEIMGWSVSTAVRMATTYGHVNLTTRQLATEQCEKFKETTLGWAQKWAQSETTGKVQ
jgi:integrase